jgi:S1-C subfamily serine protease
LPTVTEIPEELKDREMDVPYVPIPLPSADFAWKLEYNIAGKDRVRLGVMLGRENGGEEIRITSVSPNSIAQKAGILDGDIFLRMDGESLENVDDLIDRLQMKKYGDTVSIGLLRGTEEIILMVPLTKEEIKN